MDEIKVAVLGCEKEPKTELIKNLTGNFRSVKLGGMNTDIDIGYTTANGRRLYLFGGTREERKRFFEEVLPAGIDLGIVVVDSSKGISPEDKELIEEMKERNMPCMVFLNDKKETELHSFGRTIVHGSAWNKESANRLRDFLTKAT
ncbi:MAG: hypothetical protein D6733_03155 [Methanobacteriota archaeon]|nr:MAG: hypothetical protein D6733_03155 [Euryarchaeota archaeon]